MFLHGLFAVFDDAVLQGFFVQIRPGEKCQWEYGCGEGTRYFRYELQRINGLFFCLPRIVHDEIIGDFQAFERVDDPAGFQYPVPGVCSLIELGNPRRSGLDCHPDLVHACFNHRLHQLFFYNHGLAAAHVDGHVDMLLVLVPEMLQLLFGIEKEGVIFDSQLFHERELLFYVF